MSYQRPVAAGYEKKCSLLKNDPCLYLMVSQQKAWSTPQDSWKAHWHCHSGVLSSRSDFRTPAAENVQLWLTQVLLQLQPSGVFSSRVSFCSCSCQSFKSTASLNVCTQLYGLKISKGCGGTYQANMASVEPLQGWRKEKFLADDFTQLLIHSSSHCDFLWFL